MGDGRSGMRALKLDWPGEGGRDHKHHARK